MGLEVQVRPGPEKEPDEDAEIAEGGAMVEEKGDGPRPEC